jgi:hypothetical protein
MCIMCIEIFKNRMTVPEARRALKELVEFESDSDKLAHYQKLANLDDEGLVKYANDTAELGEK